MTASTALARVVPIAAACLAAPLLAGPPNPGASCTFPTAGAYGAGDEPTSVAIGDLDGDGDPDLAVANGDSDDISVLLNAGDGTFVTDVTYGAGDYPRSVAIGDLDGDGDHDLEFGRAHG